MTPIPLADRCTVLDRALASAVRSRPVPAKPIEAYALSGTDRHTPPAKRTATSGAQDGRRPDGHHHGSADVLHHPRHDQLGETVGRRAQRRGDGAHRDRPGEDAPAAPTVRGPAAHGEERGQSHRIGGHGDTDGLRPGPEGSGHLGAAVEMIVASRFSMKNAPATSSVGPRRLPVRP